MTSISRRVFLRRGGVAIAVATSMARWAGEVAAAESRRQFTMDLVCGAIGVNADQREAIRLAHAHGFESVAPSPQFLAELTDGQLDELLGDLRAKRLVWGAAGLPVNFRRDETTFRTELKALPQLAKALQLAGVSRVSTWIGPSHQELTYIQNFRQHAARLREIAKILGDCGQRFGLEYVGPKTSWTGSRFPFIHSMAEMKDLLAEIAQPNVGFVLDSWHWYTAGETADDLRSLQNRDVVACDLNDAPAGIAVDQQRDNSRELPAATGVIDLRAFLTALVDIGYDGPVRAEPFNRELNALDNEAAVEATAAAMKKAFALLHSEAG
ncbi:MAG: sugar phosphate isomerase/epimerase [Pirellulaceae bacterium]|nr:sugar phosphate isomerase/epimerase [Pirellulaceae bacterium]